MDFRTKFATNVMRSSASALYNRLFRAIRYFRDLIGSISMILFKEYKIKTKSCQKSDLQQVIKIYREQLGNGAEKAIQRDQALFNKVFYIFKDDKDIVLGYCAYYIHIDLKRGKFIKVATMDSIAVDDVCKRQGIGSVLLKESINELKENNVWRIRLFVYVNNLSALNLYKKHGFKVVGMKDGICSRGSCYEMELSLNNLLEDAQ